jgi:hypothetical protein
MLTTRAADLLYILLLSVRRVSITRTPPVDERNTEIRTLNNAQPVQRWLPRLPWSQPTGCSL